MFRVTEDVIANWAGASREAESALPELARRVLLGVIGFADLRRVDVGAGKAVSVGGFDGILETAGETLFAKTATSCWEISVEGNPRGKAGRDYRKRLADARRDVTYVALTGRLWSGKRKWAEARRRENAWADVRAYDASDLATWLTAAPAAAVWFLDILKRPVDGILPGETFLRNWSFRTKPTFPPDIALAGRDEVKKAIEAWLGKPPGMLRVWALTREESAVAGLAAFPSAVGQSPADWLARSLVVTSAEAWNRVTAAATAFEQPLVLIPLFPEFDGSALTAQRHYLLVPEEPGVSSGDAEVRLGPLPRDPLKTTLTPLLNDEHKAELLAHQSGGKLTALQRLCGHVPHRPGWASATETGLGNVLLLAGGWKPDHAGDRRTIAELAEGVPWTAVEELTVQLRNCPDAPLRTYQDGIKWRSKADAWRLLAETITPSQLQRFRAVCVRCLSEENPRYSLPPSERFMANIKGAVPTESEHLRDGLAETLVWLALNGDALPGDAKSLVDGIVRAVLLGSWKVWAGLGQNLGVLAEAAPDAFLDACEGACEGSPSTFADLLGQETGGDFMTTGCEHAALLWALETLAWNADLFPRVADVLARLCNLDTGGRSGNRPLATLDGYYNPMLRYSSASVGGRIAVLRNLVRVHEGVAWRLVCSFGAAFSGGCYMGCSRPRFRAWDIPTEFAEFSGPERREFIRAIRELTRSCIEHVPSRLADLLLPARFGVFSAKEFEDLLRSNLSGLRQAGDEIVASLRGKLREMLMYLDGKEEAECRALVQAMVDLLKPQSVVLRHAWLFRFHVDLPGFAPEKWQEEQEEGDRLRTEALQEVLCQPLPWVALLSLVRTDCHADVVGRMLGQRPDALTWRDSVYPLATHQEDRFARFARGFWLACWQREGGDWGLSELDAQRPKYGAEWAVALVGACRSTCEIRDWVEAQGGELADLYWRRATFDMAEFRDAADFARTVDRLLATQRWDAALYAADSAMYRKVSETTASYLRVLDLGRGATAEEHRRAFEGSGRGQHVVAELFSQLDKCREVSPDALLALELFYFNVLDHSRRPPRVVFERLGESPEFFVQALLTRYPVLEGTPGEPSAVQRSEEQLQRARNAASLARAVLTAWQTYPGYGLSSGERDARLRSWCERVRSLCREADSEGVAEGRVGEILSRVPAREADGVWPGLVAREYIESGARAIAAGIHVGRCKARGVTTRSPDAGGRLERDLAAQYRSDAVKIRDGWPGTARFLNQMAEGYERDATRHDWYSEDVVDP